MYPGSLAGSDPVRHTVQKRRLPSEHGSLVPEGDMRFARKVGEYYRRHGYDALHYQEQQFEEAVASRRREAEQRLQTGKVFKLPVFIFILSF